MKNMTQYILAFGVITACAQPTLVKAGGHGGGVEMGEKELSCHQNCEDGVMPAGNKFSGYTNWAECISMCNNEDI